MKGIALMLAVVCALAVATSRGWAKDLCIQGATFPAQPFVGKSFKIPGKNKCKPFSGFSTSGVAVGTGCTTFDGSLFRLDVSSHMKENDTSFTVTCTFSLPLMTGDCRAQYITPGPTITNIASPATAAPCSVDVP